VRYKKLFVFAEAYENTRKLKISMESINLHLTFIRFCIGRNWTFKRLLLGEKRGIQETDEKHAGCGILMKKGRECGIRSPPSRPTKITRLCVNSVL